MTFEELKDKAHSLPLKPGVYIMQDVKNTVIYVGKAKALKNRVSQYFQDSASHTEKTRAMVSQIDHFDVIIADSEFEALVLECSLIKRHQPRYNILLKDDKGYPYIRLSKEPYPRFSLAGKVAEDGARYFGPYASRGNTQGIIDALRDALRLPSCHKKFPRDIGKERPCLNFHMGKCDGYCRSEAMREQHDQAMAQAVSLLEGRFKEVQAERMAADSSYEPLNIACVFSPPAEGNKDVQQIQEELPQEKHDNAEAPEEKRLLSRPLLLTIMPTMVPTIAFMNLTCTIRIYKNASRISNTPTKTCPTRKKLM